MTQIVKFFEESSKELTSLGIWADFTSSAKKINDQVFNDKARGDIRFNSIHWALDVTSLIRQIFYGYSWMTAYSQFYKSLVKEGELSANVDFHTTYHVDNTITRINACKDKLGLMVWSYYCPINPEKKDEMLSLYAILERLRYPVKFGIKLKSPQCFERSLSKLEGKDFDNVSAYRHTKIHRLEPRVEIYGVQKHHGIPYRVPLFKESEKASFRRDLQASTGQSSNISFTKEDIEKGLTAKFFKPGWGMIEESCTVNGVIYNDIKPKQKYWSYEGIEKDVFSCMDKIINVSTDCFNILIRRAPFKK